MRTLTSANKLSPPIAFNYFRLPSFERPNAWFIRNCFKMHTKGVVRRYSSFERQTVEFSSVPRLKILSLEVSTNSKRLS